MPSPIATLVDLVNAQSEASPEKSLFTFLKEDGTEANQLSFAGLSRRARAISSALREHAAEGERAMLLYRPGTEYIAGLFATLHAGLVAVPAYPPNPAQLERTLPRLRAIMHDAQPRVVLTSSQLLPVAEKIAAIAPELRGLRWVATDLVPDEEAHAYRAPALTADDLAILQYTSGSTGTPKGVMVSHGNVLHNLALIKRLFCVDAETVMVSWLPPFHDMGLIGSIFVPLFAGGRAVLMAPHAFLMSPYRWLAAISQYRGTLAGGPNFGFDLCVKKVPAARRSGLDLSSWVTAYCGAEPIRAETAERFIEAFAAQGLKRRAFSPCYGMAETTLLVSVKPAALDPRTYTLDNAALEQGRLQPAATGCAARTLVSCGESGEGHSFTIVDPDALTPLPDGRVGEIWVHGPSVARGYWQKPELTAEAFGARLATGKGPYLRTGDLGFVEQGELFVTGRRKDLIIIRGRNHYPQDLEATATECHPALRPGCGIACSIERDAEERLALVLEVDARKAGTFEEVALAVCRAIAEAHELTPCQIALIAPGRLPKTTSGKVQRQATRRALVEGTLALQYSWREPGSLPAEAANVGAQPARSCGRDAIRSWLLARLAERVRLPPSALSANTPFQELGLDSASSLSLLGELSEWLGRPLEPTLPWEHPNVERLSAHLAGEAEHEPSAASQPRAAEPAVRDGAVEPIAIIGMACRFPGASGLAAFWQLLEQGVDAIEEIPAQRWNLTDYYDPDPGQPGRMTTRWGGFIAEIDRFDRGFFGISPREAARMDPQQRLLLEVAWDALEDAGQPVEQLAGTRTGVFVGISSMDYGMLQLSSPELADAYAGTGSALSIAANRLSYAFDLRGPSLSIDTACSSSLVAIHQACQSLRAGESNLAVVAGVNALLSPEVMITFSKAGLMAPDGRCKPFDARANGYVRSEGAGVIVLKPLSRALADGDPIHALIRGSAIVQDGRSNGLTAPSRQAQEAVLRAAYQSAGVSPGRVRYVEAHGTGTALGDVIEAHALGSVLASGRAPGDACLIGSVKGNIGHLEAAAGIAGVIKTALSLRERAWPATVNHESPNPAARLSEHGLRVQAQLERLSAFSGPAIAGVSSFGFGGTNAHVVLESGPERPTPPSAANATGPWLLPLSAMNAHALQARLQQYATLQTDSRSDALIHTASVRRSHLRHRVALLGHDLPEQQLHARALLAGGGLAGLRVGELAAATEAKLVFAFCGQGAQHVQMARALLAEEPVFLAALRECDALLRPLVGRSLFDELEADASRSRLAQTAVAQPVLFAVQIALAAVWRAWGIEPDAVVGHSVGEIAAAHVAGALSLPQAAQLVFERSRLMQRATGQGKMALVQLSPAAAAELLQGRQGRLSIAAENGPDATVIAGDTAELNELVCALEQRQIGARILAVDYAFHSPQLEPLSAELAQALADLQPTGTAIPMISTVTGQAIAGPELTAAYWAEQLRAPVRFARAIDTLIARGCGAFLEIGPHPVLAADIAQCLRSRGRAGVVLPSLRRAEDERRTMLATLGALYALGRDPNWRALQPTAAACVALPAYPWQRERCWLPELRAPRTPRAAERSSVPAEWLYEVQWQPATLPDGTAATTSALWLIFADRQGVGGRVAEAVRGQGAHVLVVPHGEVDAGRPVWDAATLEPFLQQCGTDSELRVLYLWSLDDVLDHTADAAAMSAAVTASCSATSALVQGLMQLTARDRRLWVITCGAQPIGDHDPRVALAQSAQWGLGRTLASEHPALWGGLIDLDPQASAADSAAQLIALLSSPLTEDQAALRAGALLVPRLVRRAELAAPDQERHAVYLRPEASYLVTGGLGGIGPQITGWLAERGARRVILLARTPLPPRSRWAGLADDDRQRARIAAVQRLEAQGMSVHVAALDVADEAALSAYLTQFQEQFPAIRGVIHAAGVLGAGDQPVVQLDDASFAEVLSPKVQGGFGLHRALRAQPLDFFISFSSAAAIIGLPGQAAYAAANAFLDALAHERKALGLAGLSVDWGPWAEAGMAATAQRSEQLARRGMLPMAADQARAAIAPLLACERPQLSVMSVDWSVLRPLFESLGPRPFFSRLELTPSPLAQTHAPSLRAELLAQARPERARELSRWLQAELARTLGIPPLQLEHDAPLRRLGFDSIMALELINRVQSQLALAVPMAMLLRGASLAALVELLLERLDETALAPAAPELAPIPRRSNGDTAPLSFAQERFWLMHQLEPRSATANLAGQLQFAGALDHALLERAFNELVRRHELLRSVFEERGGRPVQVVVEPRPITLPLHDLSQLSAAERAAALERLCVEEPRRPYDLAAGPLWRPILIRLAEREHILVVAMHHLVSDGWSIMTVLTRELEALYTAFSAGRPSPLPELPLQYSDYAIWERAELQGGQQREQLAYWNERLADAPEALALPTRARGPAAERSGARQAIALSPELVAALHELCAAEGVTLFMSLLAGLKVLLMRYSGQEDLCVAAPITRRTRGELEALIGPILNTLVLRTDLSGDPSFRELLGRVREGVLEAHAHQDLPFEQLLHELSPARRTPLFQVALTMQNSPLAELSFPGLTLTSVAGDSGSGQDELRLEIWHTPHGLRAFWVYNTQLFEASTLARMGKQLCVLLQAAAHNPSLPVSDLPLMAANEMEQLLVGWNDTAVPREPACMSALFEAQAQTSPRAPALVFGEQSWSYDELNRRANQIAHQLASFGVGPEVRVGLCVERSPELVAGMLGIMKAGGAFVPLDPSYPAERLAFMMRDAALPVLVTQEALADELPFAGQLLCLDGDAKQLAAQSHDDPKPRTTPDNLAYVIYTSGSTGTPKGTLLTQRGLCNTALAAVGAHGFGPDSRVLQYAAAGFDAAVCEVFSTLLAGGCLCLAPREELLPDAPLRELLERQRITAVTLTPSVLAQLSAEGLPQLTTIISAGEACTPELVRRWSRAGRSLLNAYGPTEVSVCATITRGSAVPEQITIGRPWDNVQTYVLDAELRPAPIGVAGELYVAGLGLGRGYHGRPGLTAQRFIPHPYSRAPGARLYRTGDRARYLEDGQLEYLGRVDDQVKLRGFRIELGEIEAALAEQAGVREAVAVVRDDPGTPRRLVAYVVAQPERPLDALALRAALRRRLPDYMVPAQIMLLAALPLNAHGKLERKALPVPELALERAFAAPRDELEARLAGIWAELLGAPRVGIHDDFFELGGHSLIATQVASRLRAQFGLDVPLARLFAGPTVAQLAAAVAELQAEARGTSMPPLSAGVRPPRVPLSFAQQRLWFLDQMDPGTPLFNIPVTLHMRGALRDDVLERSFGELVRRHESLRTSFPSDERGPYQVISEVASPVMQRIDLSGRDEAERAEQLQRWETREALAGFDLATGPLLRAILLQLGPEEHVLLLSLHHIVCDGWSMRVVVRELAELYTALGREQPAQLPELPVQYADYALWQHAWLQGDVLEAQLAHWKRKLADMPAALELPADHPNATARSRRGGRLTRLLPQQLSAAVDALSRGESVTPFVVLLAAFKLLLHRCSGQTDIVVGTDVAHRNHAETEGMIGFFVNQLALRTDLSGDPSFRELLGRVRDVAVDAFAHQDLPFEELVKALNPERTLGHTPLVQAKLSYEYDADYALKLPGLVLQSHGRDTGMAKLDLTLSVRETTQGMFCLCEYSSELFEDATIARLLERLQIVLEQVVVDAERRLSELTLMAADEAALLQRWNETALPRAELCAHTLFEAQVLKCPQADAVSFGDETWSYAELDLRANQIAHALRKRGVGPEVRVGLCVERSCGLVAGMLGILKAGGAFVPLDPSYPAERLAFMMRDAALAVLVTEQALADELPFAGQVLCLDADAALLAAERQDAPDSRTSAANLAYVIYTSGSTGTPKGALLVHRGLCNTALAAISTLGLDPHSRVLQYAAAGFDAAVWEVFSTLLAGGCLCLAPREELLPDAPLRELLERQRIDTVTLTPSVLTQLSPDGLPLLRTIVTAGEACTRELARRWTRAERTLFNAYGPTEVSVCATITEGCVSPEQITIGRPWANVQAYILDAELRPVPIGVAGELCVAGSGVGRGYHGRAGLTAEKFQPNPYSDVPGARLYRTGDRARYRKDGQIEYLGRIDSQVKLRGFRIELEEIEAALSELPGVREAVAVVREDPATPRRLVAYAVALPGCALDVSALREALLRRLPDYMVPAVFVTLAALPLTPNGKLDRKALPAPDAVRPNLIESYVAPRTETEARLVEVWQSLLGVERVGVEDNFFELGGDSITGIQSLARARQFGIYLTPKQLFQYQTIAGLAAVARSEADAAIIAEQAVPAGPIPLTPIQHWFLSQGQPEPHHHNQALMLSLHEPLDETLLEQALQHVVEHHDALRLRFDDKGAGWQQRQTAGEGATLLQAADLGELGALQAGFDLSAGPLLRAALFSREQRLLIVIHHLVVDGVSWRILLEDLATAYRQLQRAEPVALPAKTSAFKRWAERLVGYAESESLLRELPYWLAERDGLRLPTHAELAANSVASEQTFSLALDAEDTRLLLQEVPNAYRARIDDVLLTALALAFERELGRGPLWVDLEGHGRSELFEELDLSRSVGWFTSSYPVRLELPQAASLGDALRAVRGSLREVPRQGVGFGVLRYLSRHASELRALPTAEVSFNYFGQATTSAAKDTALFSFCRDATGPTRSLRQRRSHLIAVDALVVREAGNHLLQLTWSYSEQLHERGWIAALAEAYLAALRALIRERRSPDAARQTPADFPLARLTQQELERLLPAQDIYPLTSMQQGLLFHSLLDPKASVYVVQSRWRVHALAHPAAFRLAWEALVKRRAVLRTSLCWDGLSQPVQVVHEQVELPWQEFDWRGLSAQAQNAQLQQFLRDDFARGFDLTRAPLMRMAVLRQADDVYQIVWTHHHAIMDGWSMGLLFKELFTAYQALASGGSASLAEAPPYAAYVAWLQRQDLDRAESYWRDALQGFVAPTPLPGERATRAGDAGPVTREYCLELTAAETTELNAFARRHKLTLNTLTQAAWALLLAQHSGQRDVVFGSTVAGRPAELPDVESMTGLFINSLPVRVRLPEHAQLVPWLQALQLQQAEQQQYEHTPLVRIQSWSELPRGTQLFDSLLVFENYPLDAAVQALSAGLDVQDVHVAESLTFPLVFTVLPRAALSLRLSYHASRFDRAGIERSAQQLVAALKSLAAGPERLDQVSLMSASERAVVLFGWNETALRFPEQRSVHELFEQQVRRTPDAIALVAGAERLAYAELNRRANRLAQHLQQLGVGPDSRVGLCLPRSSSLVVGLLGILKAGGCYVALDPSYPSQRLAFMLEDAAISLLVSEGRIADELPTRGEQLVLLDEDAALLARCSDADLPVRTQPDNLAYIIYTSGSTGRPKGAMLTHRGLVNYLAWCTRAYEVDKGSGSPVHSSVAFDLTVTSLLAPLMVGKAAELLIDTEQAEGLADALHSADAFSLVKLTPSHLRVLSQLVDPPSVVGKTRAFVIGGETLTAETLAFWREHAPEARLINEYGPTETVVGCCVHEVLAGESIEGAVPIGRPIANTELYVLDPGHQPVPIGVRGELYIGGVQLARGYWRRPALTAERFVPNPFSRDPGARLYRTGDIARYLPDGRLECLGRVDDQVKLRGYRIELGEIEAALGRCPGVAQAAAIVREDAPGERRLVAYAVAEPEQQTTSDALRSALAAELPEHMVPHAVVVLDALPLTPNGKVDRKALPGPDAGRPELAQAYVAPRDDNEQRLAQIWADLLGLDRVGVYDNFFELGGDSIISIQVIARARQAGMFLTPKQLFDLETIAELAAVAGQAQAPAGEPEPVDGPVRLTPIQHWFFEQALPDQQHFDQAVVLDLRAPLELDLLERAFQALVQHHDALRLRFVQRDGAWHQSYANGEHAPIVQSGAGMTLQQRAAALTGRLDLAHGPLLAAAVSDQQLLIVIHHLVVDGVSWRILLEDLATAYGQLKHGAAIALPPKTTSFQAWSARLAEYAQSARLRAELPDWCEPSGTSPLPRDHRHGENSYASERTLSVSLEVEETALLLQRVPAAYRAPIDAVLVTALAQALEPWTGSAGLWLDLEAHGRADLFEEVDLSRTVGWFTALYPVRIELPAAGPAAALRAVRDSLQRVPDRGIGYGLLRYLSAELPPPAAQPEVVFNYLGQARATDSASPLFRLSQAAAGPLRSPRGRRSHALVIDAIARPEQAGSRLELSFAYSENLHARSSIEALAQRYLAALRSLIALRTSLAASDYSPGDFPLAQLDAAQLAQLPRPIEDVYALTPLQRLLAHETRREPNPSTYLVQSYFRVHSPLDLPAFQRAWQHIVHEHAALRTAISSDGLHQVVHPHALLPWQTHDLRGRSQPEQQLRRDELLRADFGRGFALDTAPLVRVNVLRLEDALYEVIWTHHHAIMDGWSMGILFSDLFKAYDAARQGRELALERAPGFRDHIAWLAQREHSASREWWAAALADRTAATPVPGQRRLHAVRPADPATRAESLHLTATATAGLQSFARQQQLTLNTLVQAAWALALGRDADSDDVVFGVISSGRPAELPHIERIVGLFSTLLPVRIALRPEQRVLRWLHDIQAQQAALREHEHADLAQLADFQHESVLVVENFPLDGTGSDSAGTLSDGSARLVEHLRQASRLDIRDYRATPMHVTFPLLLTVLPQTELFLHAAYQTNHFEPVAVRKLLETLRELLEQLPALGSLHRPSGTGTRP